MYVQNELRKVVIVAGGVCSERYVSLATGKSVFGSLQSDGLDVEFYDFDGDIKKFISFIVGFDDVIVFNALHGKYGEDGRLVGLLDMLHIPYTHSSYLASSISMDKVILKHIAMSLGIKTPNYSIVNTQDLKLDNLPMPYPFILKPINEGSSNNVFCIKSDYDLMSHLLDAQNYEYLLCEQYIKGAECTVGVLNRSALAVTDISFTADVFDYNLKYSQSILKNYQLPSNLPQELTRLLMQQSEMLFIILRINTILRVDFIVEEGTSIPYLLEANTHPGLTENSFIPEQALYNGISFNDLCLQLINNATFEK